MLKTHIQLRRMIKKMDEVMQRLKFKLALGKTFIGPIHKGFDFLVFCFNHHGKVALAKKAIQNFKERLAELYEKGGG